MRSIWKRGLALTNINYLDPNELLQPRGGLLSLNIGINTIQSRLYQASSLEYQYISGRMKGRKSGLRDLTEFASAQSDQD